MPVIPFVSGLSIGDAVTTLADAGYAIAGQRGQNDDLVPVGIVIDTDPPSGLELGTEVPVIVLVVSEGPLPPTVPDVVGLTGQQAVAILQAAGYQVTSEFVPSPEDAGGTVITQDPAGDSFAFPPGPVHLGIGAPPVSSKPPVTPRTE
jgi:serine/threonine-protein kinase